MINYILVGMQYGDEGKGSFVDFLTAEENIKAIVRFNGGSQASHTVVTSDGVLHKFSQLGSGMFSPDVETYITENVVVNLENLLCEAEYFAKETKAPLESILKRISIHENCYLVTPYHILMNLLRELSQGKNRRGTVGTGVSEVKKILKEGKEENPNGELLGVQVKDILNKDGLKDLKRKHYLLQRHVQRFYESHSQTIWKNAPEHTLQTLQRKISFLLRNRRAYEETATIYYQYFWEKEGNVLLQNSHFFSRNDFLKKQQDNILYEGAQGLLLDARYGTCPNTTFLDTTAHFAYQLAEGTGEIKRYGIVKAFCSRHGIGAFPTEDEMLNATIIDMNQSESFWNGKIRFGWLDIVLLRYAQKVNQVDSLFLSSLDLLSNFNVLKICYAYEYLGEVDEEFERVFDYSIEENEVIKIYGIKRSSEQLGNYLEHCIPQYHYGLGWKQDISKIKKKEDLPLACIEYIRLIENLVGIPVSLISIGPTKEDKILL